MSIYHFSTDTDGVIRLTFESGALRPSHEGNGPEDVTLFGAASPGDEQNILVPIRGNKNVLASAGSHLKNLFTAHGYADSHQSEYTFENLDHDSLRCVVKIVHTGKFETNAADALAHFRCILVTAKYLDVTDLSSACEYFLTSNDRLSVINCIEIWRFGFKYDSAALMKEASIIVSKNLRLIMHHTDFLTMPKVECRKLLLSEAVIATVSADVRCLAGLAWLNHESPSRADCVDDMMNVMPFKADLISRKTVLEACDSGVMREKVKDKLFEILLNSFKKRKYEESFADEPRPLGQRDAWYVVGGREGKSDILVYDIARRTWSGLPDAPWERCFAGACAVRDRLVVMGGHKNGAPSADIDEYDICKGTWSTSQAKLGRAGDKIAVCSDGEHYAYAVAGGVYGSVLERYCAGSSPSTAAVNQMASMCFERQMGAAAVYDISSQTIFVTGGVEDNYIALYHSYTPNSKYDCASDKWCNFGKSTCCVGAHNDFASAILGDEMFVAGGWNQSGLILNTMDAFNIRTGMRYQKPQLRRPRSGCSGVALGPNVLCVVGGWDGDHELNSVACLDVRENKWTTGVIVPDMPHGNSYFGFASVE